MQSQNPLLDGLAKAMGDAAGMADGVRREAETMIHSQMQRFAAESDFVTREEYEALEDLTQAALKRIDALEEQIATLKAGD